MEQPTSHILASFLSLSGREQAAYFDIPIPAERGIWRNPLVLLLQAVGIYMPSFFDHFPTQRSGKLLEELELRVSKAGDDRVSSLQDFLGSSEWEELRQLGRTFLKEGGIGPCSIPKPLPFHQWLEQRLDREAYEDYCALLAQVVPRQQPKPYE